MEGGYGIYDLKCLGITDPCGFSGNPEFSWKLHGTESDLFQESYRIIVTKNDEKVWDSGSVISDEVFGIPYDGEALQSGTKYEWRVFSTDQNGRTAESEPGTFVTGVLDDSFWEAKWIESGRERKPVDDETNFWLIMSGQVKSDPFPEKKLNEPEYFRKEFEIVKPVKKAILFATAHGIYTVSADGNQVGNLLAPEYTKYDDHLEYQTYDITEIVGSEGSHALGFILADGWYTGKIGLMGIGNQYGDANALLFQLAVEYADGSHQYICSDESTVWSTGSYQYADLYVGEYRDMSKEPEGYDRPGYDDSAWNCPVIRDYGYENLSGQSVAPVKILRTITPSLIVTPRGETVLDAGENIAGFTSFKTKSIPGTEISLEHSEVLDDEGNFLQNIMGQNKNQKDRVLPCEAYTEYMPAFTYHGFRYVKVEGLDSVNADDFTIHVIGSDLKETGYFRCSDDSLNKLRDNIVRSQTGNMICVPTDCPQREKAGWTGDMQVYAPTAAFNSDVYAFLKRWLADMRLEQRADGQIPHVVPDIGSNKYVNGIPDDPHISSAGWGDAAVIVPYTLYKVYGDADILLENYDMMKKWMSYVIDSAGDDMLGWGKKFHFGDWLIPSIMAETHNPMETAVRTKEEAALAYLAYSCRLLSEIAQILNNSEDEKYYRCCSDKAARVFSNTFADRNGIMKQELQGLYVIALYFDLLDEKQQAGALARLEELIHKAGDCLDTGFISVPFLLDVLYTHGKKDLARTILMQDKAPSWLYEVKMGATTIWETWLAVLPDGKKTVTSYNHFAYGCVADFIYRRIGGITAIEPGYRKVRIEPGIWSGLEEAETAFDSIYGKLFVRWERKGDYVIVDITLPPGTSGELMTGNDVIAINNGTHQYKYHC